MKLLVWNGLRFTDWNKDQYGDYFVRICKEGVEKFDILDDDIDDGDCALEQCDDHAKHQADYFIDLAASSVCFVDSETGKIVLEND